MSVIEMQRPWIEHSYTFRCDFIRSTRVAVVSWPPTYTHIALIGLITCRYAISINRNPFDVFIKLL